MPGHHAVLSVGDQALLARITINASALECREISQIGARCAEPCADRSTWVCCENRARAGGCVPELFIKSRGSEIRTEDGAVGECEHTPVFRSRIEHAARGVRFGGKKRNSDRERLDDRVVL